jgi:hypothetical protein
MKRIPEFALMGAIAVFSSAGASAQATQIVDSQPDLSASNAPANLSSVPPLPRGTSTILWGTIRDVDPVLDRFTLGIVGEKPMRILYDERTQIFLDGKRIPLNQLRPSEHASVQTTLDGTSVFAISVHILSQLQQGDYSGKVVSYDPSTGDLDLVSGQGGNPIRVRVTSNTRFERKGQESFTSAQSSAADLQRGTLVSIQFDPDGKGRASATQVTLLATPGAKFVFSGNLIGLDMRTGTMMLLDPRDNTTYQIEFEPGTIPSIQNVHAGQSIRITAEYDGTRYLAQDVTAR